MSPRARAASPVWEATRIYTRPGRAYLDVIARCWRLSDACKRLLALIWSYDKGGPRGAYVGQSRLAEDLAWSLDTLKKHRAALVRRRLLASDKMVGDRNRRSWCVIWPEWQLGQLPDRLTRSKQIEAARQFDAWIAAQDQATATQVERAE